MIVKCNCCNKKFNKEKYQINRSTNHYCSRSCAATVNNRIFKKRNKKLRHCKNCKVEIKGSGKIYCSIKCQNIFQSEVKIKLWKIGKDDGYETNGTVRRYIKKFLLEERGKRCEECGWDRINPNTNKCPLEIHHKDGNYKNNKEDNLQILCPNCHSLTDTYKNMNKGNGRECRR